MLLNIRPAARALTGCAALLVGGLIAGCDPLGPRHDAITVELDTNDGTPVRMVTSEDFSVAINSAQQEVFLLREADTTWVEVPFSQVFPIGESGRFYVRAMETEAPETVVAMRVLVDGDLSFQRETTITGEGIQYYYRTH